VNQLIIHGHAVKTLESKETKASEEITVTHNSVFAAHRLQCRMTIRKIDIRHFVSPSKESGKQEILEGIALVRAPNRQSQIQNKIGLTCSRNWRLPAINY
jgi:type III secretory pathway lipoprotein EscJ